MILVMHMKPYLKSTYCLHFNHLYDLLMLFYICSILIVQILLEIALSIAKEKAELRSIKLLQNFCQESVCNPCFLLQHYICYCSSQLICKNECISYHQRLTGLQILSNQSYTHSSYITSR